MPAIGLHRWSDRAVVGIAIAGVASGFGQFGAVAALGDVARSFGQVTGGTSVADQAGLSGTELGVGLAIIRLASLGGLPLAGMADRWGRRQVLLWCVGLGLALTALAALSPGYWYFVAIFAAGRPLLSATNAVAEVSAAEHTGAPDRAKAVALVTGGYGIGAGLTALVHSLGLGHLGFRGLFALALVPLALMPLLRRWTREPDRFALEAARSDHPLPVIGAVSAPFRRRLAVVAMLALAVSLISGPGTGFVFLYADNFVHQRGVVTAAMVFAAGGAGLVGLLCGRWLADHIGRRGTCTLSMVAMGAFGVLTYTGSQGALIAGYVCGVLAGSVFAPAVGAMVNEVFPTSVRASVMGWWVAAGVAGAAIGIVVFATVADIGDGFRTAAAVTFLPAVAATGLVWLLPETQGREPEQLWRASPGTPLA